MPQLGDRVPMSCPDTPLMLIGREPGPDGSYGRTEPGGPLPRDPNDPRLWLPGQGQANACGTLTLAYVLRYLLGPAAPSRERIDTFVRRGNLFSAPSLLARHARAIGLAARSYNGATLELVFDLVDRGVPVILLTDTTPLNLQDTANLHWVALVAHCDDRVGIYNPHGFQEELDLASFQAHWRQARIFGLPAWRNYAIAISRDPADLPIARGLDTASLGALLAASGVAETVNSVLGLRQRIGRHSPQARSLVGAPVDATGVLVGASQTVVGGALLLAAGVTSGLRSLFRRPAR